MNWYKIAQNIPYLRSIGVPENNLQPILDTLMSIQDNKMRARYTKYIKENPTATPQMLQQFQPLTKQDYLQKQVPQEIIKWAKNIDPDYYEWIIKQYQNKTIIPKEDDNKVSNALKLFKDLSNNKLLPQELTDINKFKTMPDLYQELKKHTDTQSENIIIDDKDPDLIYNQDGIQILEVKDPEKASLIGQGTGWCTREVEMSNKYINENEDGEPLDKPNPLYIVILDGVKSVQIHLDSSQIKNVNDGALDDYETIKRINPVLGKLGLIGKDGDFWNYQQSLHLSKKISELVAPPNGLERFKEYYEGYDPPKARYVKYIPQNIIDSQPEFREYIINAFKNDPDINQKPMVYYKDYTSEDIRNMPEIKEFFTQLFVKELEEYPSEYYRLGKELKKLPEIQQARKQGIIGNCLRNPHYLPPSDLANDPEILQARKYSWVNKGMKELGKQVYCPEELKNDPEIKEAGRQAWLRYMLSDIGGCMPVLSPEHDIPQFVREALTEQDFISVWVNYLEKNGYLFTWPSLLPAKFKTLPEIRQAFTKGTINHINTYPLGESIPSKDILLAFPEISDAIEKREYKKRERKQQEQQENKPIAKSNDWYKIAKAQTYGGYWISPSGKIIDVGFEGHIQYLLKHPKEFNTGLSPKEIDTIYREAKGDSILALAIDASFLHVSVFPPHMFIDTKSPQLAEKHRLIINQLAQKHGIIPKWKTTENISREDYNKFTVLIDANTYTQNLPQHPDTSQEDWNPMSLHERDHLNPY